MYDIINKKFYKNSASAGSFTKGPEMVDTTPEHPVPVCSIGSQGENLWDMEGFYKVLDGCHQIIHTVCCIDNIGNIHRIAPRTRIKKRHKHTSFIQSSMLWQNLSPTAATISF